MRVEKVAEQEKLFKEKLTNANNNKYTVLKKTKMIKKSIWSIRPNFDTYYYPEDTQKKKIVLHYTVGHLRGDLATLNKKDYHVSVPYVIARDGTVYELFDPEQWAYHLGNGAMGGNKGMSKDSIGIELSNYGPLTLVGDNLETAYSKEGRKDIYCNKDQKKYYTEVDPAYRGHSHYASFTKAQYVALQELLNYLCNKFKIPYTILPIEKRYDIFTSAEAKAFKGIASHVNFRKSGKTDIGIAFDWSYLQKRVFKIDVTQMPKPKAEEHMKKMAKELSRKIDYTADSGEAKKVKFDKMGKYDPETGCITPNGPTPPDTYTDIDTDTDEMEYELEEPKIDESNFMKAIFDSIFKFFNKRIRRIHH